MLFCKIKFLSLSLRTAKARQSVCSSNASDNILGNSHNNNSSSSDVGNNSWKQFYTGDVHSCTLLLLWNTHTGRTLMCVCVHVARVMRYVLFRPRDGCCWREMGDILGDNKNKHRIYLQGWKSRIGGVDAGAAVVVGGKTGGAHNGRDKFGKVKLCPGKKSTFPSYFSQTEKPG